ncbi:MAG: response regulator [Lachnospiraceae bacterium]|nr:response regulator [Lachnospiraceae bacterium]
MRFVPINRAVPGMILSKAIFDSEHRVLLSADMELTQDFIDRLEERGLPGFYIEDELTKDIVIEDAVPEELRGKAVECLIRNDIDETLNIVQQIVDRLRDSNVITFDLIDLRTFDEYTYCHCVNVAILATVVGIGLKLSKKALIQLCTAAILHDIGKLQIDSNILNKPSRLSPDEFAIMKKHSEMSYDIIKNKLEISAVTKFAILHHHENMDGTGYPKGLSGNDIHLFSRIIHVVDVYDALTTARPYKSAYSPMESIEYLMGGSSTMFDPDVVKTFIRYVPIYPKGISLLLSTGDEAVVVENHMENMSRPKVRTFDGVDIDLMLDRNATNITIVRVLDNSYTSRNTGKRDTRKHILVVDDMVVNLKSIEGILGGLYRVSAARSCEQALNLLRRRKPDLILLDIDMPDMNGIELAKKIKKEYSDDIIIIFVSSLSSKEIVMKSQAVEPQDYILKPYRALYLLDRISKALGEEHVIV